MKREYKVLIIVPILIYILYGIFFFIDSDNVNAQSPNRVRVINEDQRLHRIYDSEAGIVCYTIMDKHYIKAEYLSC